MEEVQPNLYQVPSNGPTQQQRGHEPRDNTSNKDVIPNTLKAAVLKDLGENTKNTYILVRRPRTPSFLLLHPIRFLTGKRWVRADKIDHLDALTFTENTPVQQRSQGRRTTVGDAIQHLQSPDAKDHYVLLDRPRTPAFFMRHPFLFWTGKQWTRADKMTPRDYARLTR